MRNLKRVVVLLIAMGLVNWLAPEAAAQPYPCVDQPGLSLFDPNMDDVLTIEELQGIADQFPDNTTLQNLVDQATDEGLAGIQYQNCENGVGAQVNAVDQQTDAGLVDADTGVDARLEALEAKVAELERRVDALEERIGALEEHGTSEGSANGEGEDNGHEAGVVTISGTGSTVSEDFHLDAGRYEVTLTLDGGCCMTAYLYGPSGDSDLLFNEIFGLETEGGTATDIYQAAEAGSYFIDAQNTVDSWSITFRKR